MFKSLNICLIICVSFLVTTCLPHTQGSQGKSGNFQVEENLRETQGI